MTHVISWAGPHRMNHRGYYTARWWTESFDREGTTVMHGNNLECTCGMAEASLCRHDLCGHSSSARLARLTEVSA